MKQGVQMNKRYVQSFLMVSIGFFAMHLPVRAGGAATAHRLAAAISHSLRMRSVGVGSVILRTNDNEVQGADASSADGR